MKMIIASLLMSSKKRTERLSRTFQIVVVVKRDHLEREMPGVSCQGRVSKISGYFM